MSQTQTTVVNLERFKGSLAVNLSNRCKFGNEKKASTDKISLRQAIDYELNRARETAARELTEAEKKAAEQKAKDRLKVAKTLIVSPELKAIVSYQNAIKTAVKAIAEPAQFMPGFFVTNQAGYKKIEALLAEATEPSTDPETDPHLPDLVEAFQNAYPRQREEGIALWRSVGQYKESDFPDPATLPGMFAINWLWVSFTTPEALSDEDKAKEREKFNRVMSDAADNMQLALRESFAALIDHATEKLTVPPGATPKIFRDSLLQNITAFIDGFSTRNVMNDEQLAALVEKAREVLTGINGTDDKQRAERLRKYENVRDQTKAQFAAIQTALDGMITERASRKFDLPDEPETPEADPKREQLDLVAA